MQPFLFPTPLIKVIYKFVQIGLVFIYTQLPPDTAADIVNIGGIEIFPYMHSPQTNHIQTGEMDLLLCESSLL